MSFGAIPFAESTLAGTLAEVVPGGGGGEPEVPLVIDPFTIEVNGVSYKPLIDSLSVDIELGRQGTASFTLCNINVVPQIGAPIRIKFYEEVLFVGAIDRLSVQSNNNQTFKTYAIECTDNSYLLFRRKVKRSFTNVSLTAIANALIADELSGDGIAIGTIDPLPSIPILDADKVSVYDLLNDAAVSIGAIFYIDNDKKLNFVSASITPAPMPLDENIVENLTQQFDRETYRNKQTVTVTGKPVTPSDVPNVVTLTTLNGTQIPQQAAIESTSGIYNDIEAITHPSSNFTIDLTKMALAYSKILLAVRGAIRETVMISTRQYGFRVGQTATIALPHLAITGSNWIIQRLSMRDLSGRWLISDLELSTASLRRRAQELWLDVVRKGKILLLPPTAITTFTQAYSTPGNFTFTVPAGVSLVQVTCRGGGGGGGGGARSTYPFRTERFVTGGNGGRGGLAISVLDVAPAEILSITVPSGGFGGNSVQQLSQTVTAIGVTGGNGGTAVVSRSGGQVCTAYGGIGGIGGQANAYTGLAATYAQSPSGSGLGNVVTVGGGAAQGSGGNGSPLINGTAGGTGSVVVEW